MKTVFFELMVQTDYTTRNGMKLCNSDFTAISSRLNAVAFFIQRRIQGFDYGAEELPGLDLLSGIIVDIYASLAKDVLLRRRIFAEARQSYPPLFASAEHFSDTPARDYRLSGYRSSSSFEELVRSQHRDGMPQRHHSLQHRRCPRGPRSPDSNHPPSRRK